jgi:hypothetical protein
MNRRRSGALVWIGLLALVTAGCARTSRPARVPVPRAFRHPGLLSSREELATLRARATTPPFAALLGTVKASAFASLSWQARPRATVWCGPYSRPSFGCGEEKDDAAAAYTHALLWAATGEAAHARKSMDILNAWAATLHEHGGHNAPLQSAWVATLLARAAEIVRYTADLWPPDQVARFSRMLETAYLPYVSEDVSGYNGNWELSMIEATLAIGVFLDDGALFDRAVAMWRQRVPAYFYLASDGVRPVPPPRTHRFDGDAALAEKWYGQTRFVDGLAQETCRDFGHTLYGLAAASNAAEMAHHQGVDLFGEQAARLAAAMELHARFLLGEAAPPWLCGGQLKLVRPATYEIAYNALHNRAGLPLPLSERLLRERVRPGRADHHMSWESFTHAGLDGPL